LARGKGSSSFSPPNRRERSLTPPSSMRFLQDQDYDFHAFLHCRVQTAPLLPFSVRLLIMFYFIARYLLVFFFFSNRLGISAPPFSPPFLCQAARFIFFSNNFATLFGGVRSFFLPFFPRVYWAVSSSPSPLEGKIDTKD